MVDIVQGIVSFLIAGCVLWWILNVVLGTTTSRWGPLALCPAMLLGVAAASSGLHYFTVDNGSVDQEWPKTFNSWFQVCVVVLQMWTAVAHVTTDFRSHGEPPTTSYR